MGRPGRPHRRHRPVLTGSACVWHIDPGLASQHVPPRAGVSPHRAGIQARASAPSLQHSGALLSWEVSRKHPFVPGSCLPPKAPVHSFLQEQGLGAFISGPRAKQKNVPGTPLQAPSAGRGWFFRFRSMEGFCSPQKLSQGPCVPCAVGAYWASLANQPRCSWCAPPPRPKPRSSRTEEAPPASRKPGSHPRPLHVIIGLAGVGPPVQAMGGWGWKWHERSGWG